MIKSLIFLIIVFFISNVCFPQEESDMCLALGAHLGIMPHKIREDGFERKSGFSWELEVAFNFNRNLAITFNFDKIYTQSNQLESIWDSRFFDESITELALGLRYSPLKTKLKPFCELQAFFVGSVHPDIKITNPEKGLGAFGVGVNFGIGAKYMIIKQLDAFIKAKYNEHFYTFTLGLNYNLLPPRTN